MATKDKGMPLKQQLLFGSQHTFGNKFPDFNLSQSHKCLDTVLPSHPFSKSNNIKDSGHTVADIYQVNGKAWNKSSKDLRFKTGKNPIFNNQDKEETQNCWKNEKNNCLKKNSSSTLSLHIAAYENSIEVETEKIKDLPKKSKAFKSVESVTQFHPKDLLEFPRQMKNCEQSAPEIMQFKASQKLASPNQGILSNEMRHSYDTLKASTPSSSFLCFKNNTMVEAPEVLQPLHDQSSKDHPQQQQDDEEETPEITLDTVADVFGFPLEEIFKDGIKYYKAKERSGELQVEYPIRLQFMALAKQIRNGPFKNEISNVGWFDLVGNDANKEWQKLGDLSREEAMLEFVRLLDVVCPTFKPHINERAAIETSKAVLERRRDSNNTVNSVTYNHLINGNAENSEVLKKYEEQRRQIQEALNKATYHQFLAYAQQTHPGDPEKQEQLIQQLREQHYEQYMSQVYARQAEAQAASLESLSLNDNLPSQPPLPPPPQQLQQQQQQPSLQGGGQRQKSPGEESSDSEIGIKTRDSYMQEGLERPRTPKDDEDESESEIEGDEVPSNPKIAPANLWNRKDIVEFKAQIKKEGPEGIIKVGHGETVTVRVPTHEEGTCLFWEFATDYYDIGFGVYFEWSISETSEVSVHVSESSDEEYDEEAESSGNPNAAPGDVESAGAMKKARDPNKPAVDEIIPVYRRDCHEEVFAGSHQYPARGVYLLKFDNSYSLWRSKTLYYRVYYSK